MSKSKRWNMCIKKIDYNSKDAALAKALKFGQRVYRCLFCGKWHLTSKG